MTADSSGIDRDIAFDIHNDVVRGRVKAHQKHGENSIESQPANSKEWLAILVEEVGEVAHALTYDSGEGTADLYEELIDVQAVAQAWASSILEGK